MVVSLLIKRLKARSGPLIDEAYPFRRCLSQLIGAACFPRREKSVYDRENESSALCHFLGTTSTRSSLSSGARFESEERGHFSDLAPR